MRLSFHPLVFCLSAVCLLFSGCVSTRHSAPLGSCLTHFKAGEKLLMAEVPGITAHESSGLYKKLEKAAREAGLQPAYAAEQEMDLRLHQVRPNADTASLAALQKLGYTYYLRVHIEGLTATQSYAHTSAEEKKDTYPATPPAYQKEEDVSKARLTFQLYTTDERRLIYTLVTQTEMRSLILPEKDGGDHAVNLSDKAMATQKAMSKGVAKLFSSCQ
ncbi:hypothetical protein [Rufibacter immobilis]|uniref:hypothetical protein n=1 Tax=Rufibacter immobilis TaxID=1348778 RepID=UPI0035E9A0BF